MPLPPSAAEPWAALECWNLEIELHLSIKCWWCVALLCHQLIFQLLLEVEAQRKKSSIGKKTKPKVFNRKKFEMLIFKKIPSFWEG